MNNDLISRSELRKAVNDFYDNHFKGLVPNELITYAEAVDNFIDNAPTVEEVSVIEFKEPLPYVKAQKIVKALSRGPQGEWIKVVENLSWHYECNQCHNRPLMARLVDEDVLSDFCPNCGAEMVIEATNEE